MSQTLKTLLTIGGSDPCGGAGIQADIRAGISCGVHVMTAITAVTAQNSHGVMAVNPVTSEILEQQINAVINEVMPDAVKIGMLGSLENAGVVSEFIRNLFGEIPVVVDPVMKASSGGNLSEESEIIIDFYGQNIFPFATVVTPNLKEATQFLETSGLKNITNPIEIAITLLRLWNTNAVALKGGHSENEEVTDILADYFDSSVVVAKTTHPRIECKNLHGTGCVYASLLASFLALGFPLQDAFMKTSKKIFEIISASCNYSLGNSAYGPLNINNYRL